MTDKLDKIKNAAEKFVGDDIKKIILIYTPPKVGSTTLVTTLRMCLGNTYAVTHLHNEVMLDVVHGIKDVTINEIIYYLAEKGLEVYVIDIYRSPVERKISEFFEKISCHHFNNTEENINEYNINSIFNRFNKLFPHLALNDHYLDKYDIAEPIPFDFDKKYTIQEIKNVKYIKLRLCDSKLWSKILTKIFKTQIFIVNDYETNTKPISKLYTKFKNEYKLPSNFIDLIANCKNLGFYYSEEEKQKYLNKFKENLADPFTPYTTDEYNFYAILCLENQHISDIEVDHYLDCGCMCKLCKQKRSKMYLKLKNGEKITERIKHTEVIMDEILNVNKKIAEIIKKKKQKTKYKSTQFMINHNSN